MLKIQDILDDIHLNEQIDDGSAAKDLLQIAQEISHEITEMEMKLKNSKVRLNEITERLNSMLGGEIRRIHPKMEVMLKGGNCTCGYRSKDLSCRPNLQTGRWEIGGRLGRNFLTNYPQMAKLSTDVSPLAKTIIDFFKKYYRSLGDQI